MIVALIGLMGSGKSTVGEILAKKLHLDFIDLDEIIAQGEGKSIVEIFEQKGEGYFRKLEHLYLKSILSQSYIVLATGGGAPTFDNNMMLLKEKSKTVFLHTSVETLVNRLAEGALKRPLLKGLTEEEQQAKLSELLEARLPVYQQANIRIDTNDKTPEEIVSEIVLRLGL